MLGRSEKMKYPSPPSSLPRSHFQGRGIFKFMAGRPTFLSIFVILLFYESSYFISVNNFLIPQLSEKITLSDQDEKQIIILMDYIESVSNFGYIIIPLIILFKLSVLTFFIQLPFLMNSVIISYKRIFNIMVRAGIISAVGESVRVFRMYFTESQFHKSASFQFIPFGLIDLIDMQNFDNIFLVFLNNFNLFELGWFVMVFSGLKQIKKINKIDAFLVLFSIWILIVLVQWALVYYFSEIGTLL